MTVVRYGAPLFMLVILFYILRAYFDIDPMIAGLIAVIVAGVEFAILSAFLKKAGDRDTEDRIG
ncbi:MAG: hypothetical protein ACSHX3_02855 [Litorimonas sp.]